MLLSPAKAEGAIEIILGSRPQALLSFKVCVCVCGLPVLMLWCVPCLCFIEFVLLCVVNVVCVFDSVYEMERELIYVITVSSKRATHTDISPLYRQRRLYYTRVNVTGGVFYFVCFFFNLYIKIK